MRCQLLLLAVAMTFADVFPQDFQARFLVHPQVVFKNNFGVAVWLIFPDLDDDFGESSRHLQVGGLMYRERDRWVEVMYGFVDYQTKPNESLFNIRISERGLKTLSIFMDLHFYKNRRLLGWLIDRSVTGKLRAGVESDNWFLVGKPDRIGFGPRVSYTFSKLPVGKSITLVLAYQYRLARKEQDFIRSYFLMNL